MAKTYSSVNLPASLIEAAKAAGLKEQRSAAEQIEFWADIGKRVAPHLSPIELLELSSGFAQAKLEPIADSVVNSGDVFQALEEKRRFGTLSHSVTRSALRYQASSRYPGKLERISLDGRIEVGIFSGGEFQADSE